MKLRMLALAGLIMTSSVPAQAINYAKIGKVVAVATAVAAAGYGAVTVGYSVIDSLFTKHPNWVKFILVNSPYTRRLVLDSWNYINDNYPEWADWLYQQHVIFS